MSSGPEIRPPGMDEITARYERIADRFTDRVRGVPPERWDDPSPCEGWTARDVVGHLTDWIPGFFGSQGIDFGDVPSVQDDPVAAWDAVRATVSGALADPAVAGRELETPMGTHSFAGTVDMIVTNDLFTHTWDLARATGQDESLDPELLRRSLASVGEMPEEAMRSSGMFGPQVEVPEGADDQTRYLAFLGRRA